MEEMALKFEVENFLKIFVYEKAWMSRHYPIQILFLYLTF
jgi:hypothetical protein